MRTNEFFHDLKQQLTSRLHELQQHNHDHFGLDEEFARESIGELSNYDNHPADNGTELYEREKDMALDQHSRREQERIEKALQAMEEGSYGTCEKCGRDISLERLESEPTALQCIQHSYQEPNIDDRPVEEERLIPGKGGFTDTTVQDVENDRFDAEESWELAGAYGTSDAPQDTYDPSLEYEGMFGDAEDDGINDEWTFGYGMTDSEGEPIDFDHDVDFSYYFLRR
ncbi:transcriptional regulator, TraR/DksA family [Alteribacillus persepolensis]|uniref:Transcriptional regulator, TraR/DksA family n=1 Tax=Alteribacillus persepolensis TaxID=568899 RepID=A0A1G8G4V7_9BACI|nr:TraR/DksA C4-type zinc finger protein [Alteribacillus persepolensis]SDH89387.1 transcriptional regulator, TraR/DksA family [Alteribacillus persepolensis]